MNYINGGDYFFDYRGQCPNTKEWQKCLVTGAECGGCGYDLINITHYSKLNYKIVTNSYVIVSGLKEDVA
jgi:hypothetical protein